MGKINGSGTFPLQANARKRIEALMSGLRGQSLKTASLHGLTDDEEFEGAVAQVRNPSARPLFNVQGAARSLHPSALKRGAGEGLRFRGNCEGRLVTHLFFPWVDTIETRNTPWHG